MERNRRKVLARLKAEGGVLVSVTGSHHKFRRGPQTVIVQHPQKDIPTGTARKIAKEAGRL